MEQLRHDIDSRRTHDKVRGGDPAAVPLGADEEAAGAPVAGEAVAQARRAELAAGRLTEDVAQHGRSRRRRWTLGVFFALAAATAAAVWFAP